ncbi:hypothetical protein JHK85_050986 [Glycine max]|nr:hypothetical protein JHK85_050986 [Glycine max]
MVDKYRIIVLLGQVLSVYGKKESSNVQETQCLMGDFNIALKDCERKKGSLRVSSRGDNAFQKFVQETYLVDLRIMELLLYG